MSSSGGQPSPHKRLMVFVDAGFLKEGGPEALGIDGPVRIDGEGLLLWVMGLASVVPGVEFFRAYVYDGELPHDHAAYADQQKEFDDLAAQPKVRVRQGHAVERTGRGRPRLEQKGVDTLLVLDMIKLAQHGSFDVGVLVAGDRDFAELVQTVEDDCGREVALISPVGARVSTELRRVADYHSEIDRTLLERIVRPR